MCGELRVASEKRPSQKGSFVGDGLGRARRWNAGETRCQMCLLLQPCCIINLLLGLRELCGCLWFLLGMREQLLSWLFGFPS